MNALSRPADPPLLPISGAVPTFAEALRAVASWTELTETRRRDMISALTTLSRALRLPPGAVPCDVAWLNARLFEVAPAVLGFSASRFRTVLSDLRAVLRRLGLHAPDTRGDHGLPGSWRAILALVPDAPRRAGLRGFARYCAEQGIDPGSVADAHLAAYAAQDRSSRLSASAQHRASSVTQAWNWAVRAALPGWPNHRLTASPRREPYTLPFEAYPQSFRDDIRAFAERLAPTGGSGIFASTDGPPRRLRPATVQARLFAIRQAAAALVLNGLDPQALTSLRDLVQPVARAGEILDHFFSRGGRKTGGQFSQIAETLRQIARYHVRLNGADLTQIEAWARRARPRSQNGMAPKARDRLRQIIAPRPRALLLHLPAELMRRAAAPDFSPAEAGRLALVATALELLLVCPLRMRNLAGLRLDRHIQRIGGRGARHITHIVLQETETKNEEPLEWPLPPDSVRLLQTYIDRFRPALADPANLHLFPAAGGTGPRGQDTIANALKLAIEREVGVQVHPHLLRHFAAWLYLNAHPGEYEMVRRVLGHRSVETTVKAYCGLEAPAAAQRFDALVLRERAATRAVAKAAWRKPGRRAARTRS